MIIFYIGFISATLLSKISASAIKKQYRSNTTNNPRGPAKINKYINENLLNTVNYMKKRNMENRQKHLKQRHRPGLWAVSLCHWSEILRAVATPPLATLASCQSLALHDCCNHTTQTNEYTSIEEIHFKLVAWKYYAYFIIAECWHLLFLTCPPLAQYKNADTFNSFDLN